MPMSWMTRDDLAIQTSDDFSIASFEVAHRTATHLAKPYPTVYQDQRWNLVPSQIVPNLSQFARGRSQMKPHFSRKKRLWTEPTTYKNNKLFLFSPAQEWLEVCNETNLEFITLIQNKTLQHPP